MYNYICVVRDAYRGISVYVYRLSTEDEMSIERALVEVGFEREVVCALIARYGESEFQKIFRGALESAQLPEDVFYTSFLPKKRKRLDLSDLEVREIVVDTAAEEFQPYCDILCTTAVTVADRYVKPRGKVRVRYAVVERTEEWKWVQYLREVRRRKFIIPDIAIASAIYDQQPKGYHVIPVMAPYTKRLLEWCSCAGHSGTGLYVFDKDRSWRSYFRTFYVIDEQPVVE